MKIAYTRLKRAILIVTGALIITVVVVILLASPIGKYIGKKYGEKYTGRQIKMGLVYINPFTGYVHISDLVIYESKNFPGYKKGDSIFFSSKSVSANFAILKLLSKTIEISEITLDHPKGIIIQNKNKLNFSDWIVAFAPKKTNSAPSTVHFSILKIIIKNGEFHYQEEVTPINYFIKDVNLESSGKRWNADTMAVKFSFSSGPQTGTAKGTLSINFKTLDFHLTAIVNKFDLNIIEQYLKPLINYGNFRANLDADIKAKGNFNDQENLVAKGMVAINDFHFGKSPEVDYASFEKLVLQIEELNPKNLKYLFDSVSLTHPFVKYEKYDYLDNLERMFGKNGENVSSAYADPARFNLIFKIVDYIKVLVKNFLHSYYKVNRIAVYKADFEFNDFSLSEKFSIKADPLYIIADSIDKNHKRLVVNLKSEIQPYGNISAILSMNPQNGEDFDLNFNLQKLPATLFNPYLLSYSSYKLDRGTIEFNGIWNVRSGNIQSVNHLVILDPRVTKRLRNKDTKWLPIPLIMSFVRERGNVIDYEIPITGNLKNPKFHLHDVIMDLLTNIFVKPATTGYRFEVKNLESTIEKSLTLKWNLRQKSLLSSQEKFVNEMVDFLKDNPDASISVYPILYADREKENILFFEARKKYFLLSKNEHLLSEDDSDLVNNLSVRDSSFVRYLNKQVGGNMMFTIQEKCNKYVGPALVDSKFKQLNKEREDALIAVFKKKSVDNQVKFYPGENTIPYNGFSFFKIVYKGEFPKAILKAYQKMNEFNDVAPRKKYKKERKQNKTLSLGGKPSS